MKHIWRPHTVHSYIIYDSMTKEYNSGYTCIHLIVGSFTLHHRATGCSIAMKGYM